MTATPATSPTLDKVRQFAAGDQVVGFYLLTKIETRPKRDGTPYLLLELQDATGHLEAKMWEGFEEIVKNAEPGDVVKIAATMDRYRDIPGLVVSKIRPATPDEAPNRRAYLPHSPLTAEAARAEIAAIIASVEHPALREILLAIFGDNEFAEAFCEAPGGKMWHHATLGGLAEHTVSLARLAERVCGHYADLNRDLMLTGALLHDVGKVFELTSAVGFDYTAEGRLLGHIVQGTLFVEKKIAALEGVDEEVRRQVLHLILSHQGEPEMGSPVKPLTLEAIVLHFLDDMDAKVNAFRQVKQKTPEGDDFSSWVNLMSRFLYFKSITGNPEAESHE